jgi:uncharacterized protein YndB with AHSA1/START domain
MIQKGYFIITDISGYTAYLSKSEINHAHEILQSLFDVQISTLKAPIEISNFQGDAILTYLPENKIIQKQTVLELVEKVYFEFSRKIKLMAFNTTCTCNACSNIANLDLKIFVHYGDFMLQELAGRSELFGTDVILVHRMMKNQVISQTGIEAYALFTKAAAEALSLESYCSGMETYKDSYEYVGEIEMFVHCLKTRLEEEGAKNRVEITKENAWVGTDLVINAPVAFVWEYITKPELKQAFFGFDSVKVIKNLEGRVQEGAVYHCAHGEMDVRYKVIDWKPLKYYTSKAAGFDVHYRNTYSVTELGDGSTLFGNYCEAPEGESATEEKRMMMQAVWDELFLNLKILVERDYQARLQIA